MLVFIFFFICKPHFQILNKILNHYWVFFFNLNWTHWVFLTHDSLTYYFYQGSQHIFTLILNVPSIVSLFRCLTSKYYITSVVPLIVWWSRFRYSGLSATVSVTIRITSGTSSYAAPPVSTGIIRSSFVSKISPTSIKQQCANTGSFRDVLLRMGIIQRQRLMTSLIFNMLCPILSFLISFTPFPSRKRVISSLVLSSPSWMNTKASNSYSACWKCCGGIFFYK